MIRLDKRYAAALLAGTAMFVISSQAQADTTPECNDGTGVESTECGTDSDTDGAAGATAVGNGASATGTDAVAIGGYNDRVAGSASVAYRLSDTTVFTGGVGVGFDSGEVGARAGFQASW